VALSRRTSFRGASIVNRVIIESFSKGFSVNQRSPDATKKEHKMKLTAIIEREGYGFFALCSELDIASQGETIEQARKNFEKR